MNIYSKIANKIIKGLSGRKGFSWWFEDIEQEGQNEIINEIAAIIQKEFEPLDEITKFMENSRPLTAEEHQILHEHFWELMSENTERENLTHSWKCEACGWLGLELNGKETVERHHRFHSKQGTKCNRDVYKKLE